MYERQKRYEKKLREQGIVRRTVFTLSYHNKLDKEVIDWLERKPNKNKYIKDLICQDMRKKKNETMDN